MKLKQLEKAAKNAIRNLRKQQLKKGLTFMINSGGLLTDQSYIEHPDGSITLVTLNRKNNDFEVIEKYSSNESDRIRKKFKLA